MEDDVKDSNGALLADGDSVQLIRDLKVKGAGFASPITRKKLNVATANRPSC